MDPAACAEIPSDDYHQLAHHSDFILTLKPKSNKVTH